MIIDDVTVNIFTDERGNLDPRLRSAIEEAVKSFTSRDKNFDPPQQSTQTSLPVRTASQKPPSISSSNDNATDPDGVGSTNGSMGTTLTISLALRPGEKKGEGDAAQIDVSKRDSSDSEGDEGWDKIDENEC